VFTNGTICSHGYCHIPATQVPVNVGGVVIRPGDLLHGDRNGVTTIPAEIASEIPEACEAFGRAEAVVLEYLNGGNATPQGFASARAECRRMLDALAARVRR
jgi:regulator of RNase E activity RraA